MTDGRPCHAVEPLGRQKGSQMIDLRFDRYALGAAALVAMLAGCGGAQSPMASPGAFNLPHKAPDTEQSQTLATADWEA